MAEFAQTLIDCRELYLSAGRRCMAAMKIGTGKDEQGVFEWLDDLHRGLLIKVYLDIALADQQWQPEPQEHHDQEDRARHGLRLRRGCEP